MHIDVLYYICNGLKVRKPFGNLFLKPFGVHQIIWKGIHLNFGVHHRLKVGLKTVGDKIKFFLFLRIQKVDRFGSRNLNGSEGMRFHVDSLITNDKKVRRYLLRQIDSLIGLHTNVGLLLFDNLCIGK